MHGGVSPLTPTVDHIRAIDRTCFEDSNTPMGHLLWSDPGDKPGFHHNTRGAMPRAASRGTGRARGAAADPSLPWTLPGAGFLFGPDITDMFCHANNLEFVARAHQLTMTVRARRRRALATPLMREGANV